MKKRVSDKTWFPFWVDKWIFGSMRIEFNLEERAIWIDLLALASKDDGYIRANEDIPYLMQQLAGILIIPEDKLTAAIDKFVEKGKLIKKANGTLLVAKWDKYQLSRTAKFYAEKGRGEQNGSHSEKKGKLDHSTLNNNISEGDTEILNLLSKVKNYPFNKEKDIEFIKALKTEFPDIDILEKVKQISLNWLKFPLNKKSRPRVQIRRWVTNESKWQKEGDKERQVGTSKDEHKEKYPMLFLNAVYKELRKQGKDNEKYSKLLFDLSDEEAEQAYIRNHDSLSKFIKYLEEKDVDKTKNS